MEQRSHQLLWQHTRPSWPGFEHGFGLRKPHQAILPPRDHQPIEHLWLLAEGKLLFNLSLSLGLHLPQPLVANRFVLGGIGMQFGPI